MAEEVDVEKEEEGSVFKKDEVAGFSTGMIGLRAASEGMVGKEIDQRGKGIEVGR
jgi:hypothetical protein